MAVDKDGWEVVPEASKDDWELIPNQTDEKGGETIPDQTKVTPTQPAEAEGGFIPSATQVLGSTIKSAGRLSADLIPGVSSQNPLMTTGQDIIDSAPTKTHSLADIKADPLTATKEAVGNAVPSMGGMLATRAAGQAITAAAPLTGVAAPVVAAIGQGISWLGPLAIAALPSYGGIRDKQILKDPKAEEDAKAIAVASLGAATVGLIENKFGPQEWALSAMTKEGRAKLAEKVATIGLTKSVVKGTVKGAAVEGAEELVQNPVEQLASGDNPLTKESIADTFFGGAMGVIGGGVLGGSINPVIDQFKGTDTDLVTPVLDHIKGQNLSPAELVSLRESPEMLAKVGLTPEHIDEAIADHPDVDAVKIAEFESVLRSAPNEQARAGLIATVAGQTYTKLAETAKTKAEEAVKARQLPYAEALTQAEEVRTTLADKLDLTPEESKQLGLLNKAGTDPKKLSKALDKDLIDIPESAIPKPAETTDLLHSDGIKAVDARIEELGVKKFRTTTEKAELQKLKVVQNDGYKIGEVAKVLKRVILKDPIAKETVSVEEPIIKDGGTVEAGVPTKGKDAVVKKAPKAKKAPTFEADPKIDQAREHVKTSGNASIVGIQKALKVSYNRAKVIADQLEADGTLSPKNKRGLRTLLVKEEAKADEVVAPEGLTYIGPNEIAGTALHEWRDEETGGNFQTLTTDTKEVTEKRDKIVKPLKADAAKKAKALASAKAKLKIKETKVETVKTETPTKDEQAQAVADKKTKAESEAKAKVSAKVEATAATMSKENAETYKTKIAELTAVNKSLKEAIPEGDIAVIATYQKQKKAIQATIRTLKDVQTTDTKKTKKTSTSTKTSSKKTQKAIVQSEKNKSKPSLSRDAVLGSKSELNDVMNNIAVHGELPPPKGEVKESAKSRIGAMKQDKSITQEARVFLETAARYIDMIDLTPVGEEISQTDTRMMARVFINLAPDHVTQLDPRLLTKDDLILMGAENANPEAIADEVNKRRRVFIEDTIRYLTSDENQGNYTTIEAATVLALLLKENHYVSDGKAMNERITGKTIRYESMFNGAIAAGAVQGLREGKGPRKAYKQAIKNLFEAKDNKAIYEANEVPLNGWHIFEQSDDRQAIAQLTAIAATCPANWCTGSGAASGQLPHGDFHIFSVDGEARIAIRMEGDDIGEISGSLSGQHLAPTEIDEVTEYAKELDPGSRTLNDIVTDQQNVRYMNEWMDSGGKAEPKFSTDIFISVPTKSDLADSLDDIFGAPKVKIEVSVSRQHNRYEDVPLLGKGQAKFDALIRENSSRFAEPTKDKSFIVNATELNTLHQSNVDSISAPNLAKINDLTITSTSRLDAPKLKEVGDLVVGGTGFTSTSIEKVHYLGLETHGSVQLDNLTELDQLMLTSQGSENSLIAFLPKVKSLEVLTLRPEGTTLELYMGNLESVENFRATQVKEDLILPSLRQIDQIALTGSELTFPSLDVLGKTSEFLNSKVRYDSTLTLPSATRILGILDVKQGSEFVAPKVKEIHGLELGDSVKVDFPEVTSIQHLNMSGLSKVTAPKLTSVAQSLSMYDNATLTAPNLESTGDTLIQDSMVDFPNLEYTGALTVDAEEWIIETDFPKLQSVFGKLTVGISTRLGADELYSIAEDLHLKRSARLFSSKLTSVGGTVTVNSQGYLNAKGLSEVPDYIKLHPGAEILVGSDSLVNDVRKPRYYIEDDGKFSEVSRETAEDNYDSLGDGDGDGVSDENRVIYDEDMWEAQSTTDEGSTVDELDNTLDDVFGETWQFLNAMGEAGKPGGIVLVDTVEEALEAIGADAKQANKYGQTQAFHNPATGLSALIASRITTDEVEGLVLHEGSVHAVLNSLLDKEAVDLFNEHADTEFMQRVKMKLDEAGLLDGSTHLDPNETRAYIVSEAMLEAPKTPGKFWAWADANLPKGVVQFLQNLTGTIGEFFNNKLTDAQLLKAVNSLTTEARGTLEVLATDVAKANTVEGKVKESLGGPKSRGADRFMLARAKSMEAKGRSAKEIQAATGWFRLFGNQWVYEIPTDKMKLGRSFRDGFILAEAPAGEEVVWEGKLEDFIKYDELFDSYVFLRNTEYDIVKDEEAYGVDEEASYSPEENKIYIRTANVYNIKKLLIHEIQHAIQEVEDTARGSNTASPVIQMVIKNAEANRDNALWNTYDFLLLNGVIDEEWRTEMFDEATEYNVDVVQLMTDEIVSVYTNNKAVRSILSEHTEEIDEMRKQIPRAWDIYAKYGGEIEARVATLASTWIDNDKSLANMLLYQLQDDRLLPIGATLEDARNLAIISKDNREEINTSEGHPLAEIKGISAKEGYFENVDGVWTNKKDLTYPEDVISLREAKKKKGLSKEDKEALKILERAFGKKDISKAAEEVIDEYLLASTNPANRLRMNLMKRIGNSVRDETNQNSSMFDRYISSPEFYFPKTVAGGKILNAAIDDATVKYKAQKEVEGEFLEKANVILKSNPKAYKQGNQYVLNADATGIGFKMRQTEEGLWEAKDRKGKVVYSDKNEKKVQDELIEVEQRWLDTQLMHQDARDLIRETRLLTNRAFDILIADMRKQMARAEENGNDEPTAIYVNDDGVSHDLSFSELIARMGDLRGTYFPRERAARKFHLIAEQKGMPSVLETFDWHLVENEMGNNKVQKMKRTFNALAPAGQRYRALLKEGYKEENLNFKSVESPSELVFDLPSTLANLDAIFTAATDKVNVDELEEMDRVWMGTIDKQLALRVADIYKAKGTHSSRMSRASKVYEGYETDLIRAITGYTSRVSTGVAKRTTAKKMLEALTGRTVSWKQWQALNKDKDYNDYLKHVRTQRVSPTEQKEMYEDLRQYIKFFLAPDDPTGRLIGYLKAGTVLKYLAFRVASAAVNSTNMVMSVPATIAAHSGRSITTTFRHIASATNVFHAYKHNQLLARGHKFLGKPRRIDSDDLAIMDIIYGNGWAEPQFNHDAAQAMSGKLGNAMNNIMGKGMWMFGAVEEANRAITILAAYKSHKGTSFSKLALAKHTSDRAHGIYGKAAKPWLVQKHRYLDAPYTFQKFQHTYHLNMLELFGKYKSPMSTAFMTLSPQVIAGTSVGTTIALGVASLMGADDPEDTYTSLLAKWLGDSDFANDFAEFGIIGAILGVNLKGSLEAKSPFPSKLSELFGAPQALVIDMIDGVKAAWKGEGKKSAEKLLPTALGSPIKGYREMTEGLTKGNYAPVFNEGKPVKLEPADFAKRFFSFNPTKVSAIRNHAWKEDQVRAAYQANRGEISSRYNRLLIQRRPPQDGEWADFWKYVAEYNKKARAAKPVYQIPLIDADWINSQQKRSFKPTKYTR